MELRLGDSALVSRLDPTPDEKRLGPDEWLLLEEEVLLTEMMECGRFVPFFRCSNDDTAIEFRERGTAAKASEERVRVIVATYLRYNGFS